MACPYLRLTVDSYARCRPHAIVGNLLYAEFLSVVMLTRCYRISKGIIDQAFGSLQNQLKFKSKTHIDAKVKY